MKVWELHGIGVGGSIRTTPDGDADIGGLILTEKAYLLAVREFRPNQIIRMVETLGAHGAAEHLVTHFGAPSAIQASSGRCLAMTRASVGGIRLVRDDEPAAAEAIGRRG